MEKSKTLLVPEGYIPKEDAADLIGRHPRTLEKIWRRSQRSSVKIRKKLVRPANGGASEAAYHREDLLDYMASQAKRRVAHPGVVAEPQERIYQEFAGLSDLVRSETDRIIAEIRNIRLHVEFGGRKNQGD